MLGIMTSRMHQDHLALMFSETITGNPSPNWQPPGRTAPPPILILGTTAMPGNHLIVSTNESKEIDFEPRLKSDYILEKQCARFSKNARVIVLQLIQRKRSGKLASIDEVDDYCKFRAPLMCQKDNARQLLSESFHVLFGGMLDSNTG